MNKFGYIRLFRDNISFWHKIYFKLIGVSPDHRLRFMYLDRMINHELQNKELNMILDAGCGSGDYSFYFADKYPDAKITSIDIDSSRVNNSIEIQKKTGKYNVNFKCDDITTLDEKNKYDLICCIDVLEHMNDVEAALSRLLTSLKKNGYIYIHLPLKKEKPVFFSKYLKEFHEWAEDEHVAEPLTKEDFAELIKNNGGHIVRQESSFNHYLGELSVSLIMLFYRDTKVNNVIKALLSPLMSALITLDIAIRNKSGNAVAVLARRA